MMLSIRTYRPTSQLILLLIAWIWVIWKSVSMSQLIPASSVYEPLSKFYFSLSAQGSALNVVIGVFMLLFQAIYLAYILQKQNIIEQNNWLPALLFLLFSSVASNFQLSPVTFANLFIILALDRMFESYESFKGVDNILLAGFYTSIAMLFYFPYILFTVAIIICLVILRNVNWRFFLITIIGVSIPILYLGTVFFVNDTLFNEISTIDVMFKNIAPSFLKLNFDGFILFGLMALLMVMSLIHITINLSGKLIKIRKKISIIIAYSIFSLLIAIISLQSFDESLIGVSLFLSTTLSMQISSAKRNLVSILLFWSVVALMLLSNFDII